MRIGSLFSGGCGGLELGLERAGVGHVVWQCEIDAAARRNLARHWPGVRQYEDVKEMNGGNTERVDVICGGFPCQDLSFAGVGAGLAGARSGLWFEYLRLVRELRPRFVVVENVPALVTRGLGVVLGGLAEAGYDAVWFTLRASDVGATHLRERLFIVAYCDVDGREKLRAREPGDGRDVRGEDGESGTEWRRDATGRNSNVGPVLGNGDGPRLEGRGLRGCGRADERPVGAAGSEVVYSDGRGCGTSRGFGDGCEVGAWRDNSDLPPATQDTGDLAHDFPPGPGDHDGWRDYLARFPNRAPAVPNAKGAPSLNPSFVEALMGFPEGWTEGTRSERLKQLGNAVVPQCAEVVGHVLLGLAAR